VKGPWISKADECARRARAIENLEKLRELLKGNP